MTTEPSRLAQLPGFDTAPDVYETPDIDDSTTTASTQQTSPRAPSEHSYTSEEEKDDDEEDGPTRVSTRRLYPQAARDRFRTQSRGVDAKGVDLSDRVDGKRKGYKLKKGVHGEDEDEGLEARIARLRREVEECRALAEAEKQGETEDEDEEVEGEGVVEDVDALSKLLAGVEVPTVRKGRKRRGSIFHDAPTTAPVQHEEAADLTDEQTLTRISAFDNRLSALETALGISSVLETTDSLFTPLLPSLALLDNQLSALTSATSLSALEAASSRINKLKSEAQQLYHLQLQPTPSSDNNDPTAENNDEESQTPALLSPEDMKKLQHLYTLLPNLQALSPTVPALITRLRSLRTLHTTAATASQDLDSLEQRQNELDRELKMWREGLGKVEEAVQKADMANGKNGATVEEWVKDLERRMKALGR
ncbi:hypothetical protein M409DRAFT_68169 [Zasmidium cellare ATCC 36951]|uniref:Dynactin subunit n=1 Tax=Zasmidium cellare ATCC 36951 TaxID=1080233 RepID=A0A6A6CE37_ZASCE|nr:uncharacterized protein M409DRAFT_68169 [Zasmidium cellare ATCC 36951]KAF2163909.1 hypothetical protein M409DRAFT_68169 [Zasmidium cellare ATCC 36951]